MNKDKIPFSINRKVCWEDGFKEGRQQAIKEFEKKMDELLKESKELDWMDFTNTRDIGILRQGTKIGFEKLKQSLNNSQMDKSLKQDGLSVPLSDTSQLKEELEFLEEDLIGIVRGGEFVRTSFIKEVIEERINKIKGVRK